MAEPHVVTALIRKRAELAGQIEHHQDRLRQLVIDLDNLDCTLRLFQPDIDLEEIRPKPLPPKHAAYRGELSRIVLGALRQSPEGLTAQQLAQHVMAERGMNTADKALVKLMGKRAGSALRDHRRKGRVTSRQGPGGRLVWRIAR